MTQDTHTRPAARNGTTTPEVPRPPAAETVPAVLPLLLTREQVAALLGLSARTVKRMTAEGAIPGVRRPYGRAVRYSRVEIEAWVARGCPRLTPAGRGR
jgi:excisionase family DNA binding protein